MISRHGPLHWLWRVPNATTYFPCEGYAPTSACCFSVCTHGWFAADSWTTKPQMVNTHQVTGRKVEHGTRHEFITGALSALIRAGADLDNLVLQSMVPDNSMQFVVFSEGDGCVAAQVSSRRWRCKFCETRPLGDSQEQVLFDLGFGAIVGEENYVAGGMPPNPNALADHAETVFYEAFEEPRGFSLWAMFNQPALAEAFYLAWNFRR